MDPLPIEELVDRVGSRFTVVIAAAKRAKQIKAGAPPLVQLPTRNPLTIALYEITSGMIEITEQLPPSDEPEPQRPVSEETSINAAAIELLKADLDGLPLAGMEIEDLDAEGEDDDVDDLEDIDDLGDGLDVEDEDEDEEWSAAEE